MIRLKRVYEEPSADDGCRVLVDRLWPRGLTKPKAALDAWLKEVAPSDGLRRRFHGGELDFAAFAGEYRAELEVNDHADELRALMDGHERLTLLYGARDEEQNHAIVLRDWISENPGDDR